MVQLKVPIQPEEVMYALDGPISFSYEAIAMEFFFFQKNMIQPTVFSEEVYLRILKNML